MTISLPLRLLVFSFAAVCTFVIATNVPAPSSGPKGEEKMTWESVNRQATDSPQQQLYFFLQRMYGSEGIVNIQQRTWDAFTELRLSPQGAMRKPFSKELTWRLEGPTNISGRVRAVAFHPDNPNIVFAGAASGGVWKSTDLGKHWDPLTDNMPVMAIGALAIDRNNPEIILAGTGEPAPVSYGRKNGSPMYLGMGVLRTDDGGLNWTLLPWPTNSSAVSRIAINPVSADTFLVATIDRMYKTIDGGQTWKTVLAGYISDVLYKPGDPSTVYAAAGDMGGSWRNGVYVSHAGGESGSWVKLDNNYPAPDSTGRTILGICESAPNRIYAAIAGNWSKLADREADFKVVMASDDGGQTWERRNGAISPKFTRSQAWYDLCIAVSPDNPDLVLLGGIDQHRSTDGGRSFQQKSNWMFRVSKPNDPGYIHADQHTIAFMPGNSSTVMVGSDGGTFVSTDAGDTWEERTTGLSTVQYYGIAYAPSNPRLLYGGTQDNSNMRQSSPSAGDWYFVEGGDGGNIAVDPVSSDLFYMCINSTPFRVFGQGAMNPLTDGLTGVGNWVRPMVLSPGDGNRLYTASNYVFRLVPASSATSWFRMSESLVRGAGSAAIVTDIAVPETAPIMMYTVSGDGMAFVAWNTVSLDVTFDDISNGLPNRWLTDITVDWSDFKKAYVAVSGYGTGHAYKTTDAGTTWTNITGDLPDVPANEIIPSRIDPNTIYLATDLGVWYTTNSGENWKQFGNGLPNVVAYDMRLTPDNRLIVGTHGRGMWSIDVVLAAENAPSVPKDITLTASPNPFGPGAGTSSARIDFSLKNEGDVRLRIFDAAGREVASLVNGRMQPGAHSATFTAGSLPAGTYFTVLEALGTRETRRLVLMR